MLERNKLLFKRGKVCNHFLMREHKREVLLLYPLLSSVLFFLKVRLAWLQYQKTFLIGKHAAELRGEQQVKHYHASKLFSSTSYSFFPN